MQLCAARWLYVVTEHGVPLVTGLGVFPDS